MKFFLDSANLDDIRQAVSWGAIDGVTTNPSLVAKEQRDFAELIREICELVDGPVSAETVSTDATGMVDEARKLAHIHPHIVAKVPLTKAGLTATRQLSSEGIRTNVTLCFSASQGLLAAKAGATYISPFIGRLDDMSHDGMALIQDLRHIYNNYQLATEILVASVRDPIHVLDAARIGADVSTVPLTVLDKLIQHPLTDSGLARFLRDWESVPMEQRGPLAPGRSNARSTQPETTRR